MRLQHNPAHSGNRRKNRTNGRRFVRIAALLSVINLGAFAQPASSLSAHWEGAIQLPDHEMGITVDLAKNPAGGENGSAACV